MLKRTFWDGFKAFVPIALTVGVTVWLFTSLENFFGRIIRYIIPAQYYFEGLGILLGIVFIFLIGLLVNAWLVKWLYDWMECILQKIPGIKTIYNAIQDLINFFDKNDQSKQQQAVIVHSAIGKVVGFVTRQSLEGTPLATEGKNEILVYIPLSYQIGGVAIVVPRSDVTPLQWPADQAMSFILTAGMTSHRT